MREERVTTFHQGVPVAMVAAMATNRCIGYKDRLPWSIPQEMAYFKAAIKGKVLILGRKTYDEIGRWLQGNTLIVVSREFSWLNGHAKSAQTVHEALTRAQLIALEQGSSEIMVIGGEQIYTLFLPYTTRIYLTLLELDNITGDAFFPPTPDFRIRQTKRRLLYRKDDESWVIALFRRYERLPGRPMLNIDHLGRPQLKE